MRLTRHAPVSLVRINTRILAAVFIVFEILIIVAVMTFLMLPMARRSADDLAGLMLLIRPDYV